jgi:hypothetical protein
MQTPKTIDDAARDALNRETHTSGLSPDQQTPMKPQETGDEGLNGMGRGEPQAWPFPPSRP